VLFHVLRYAQELGAQTQLISGEAINLPMYVPNNSHRDERTAAMVAALRGADAVVIGTPGYHGGISGLVKNALDYTEDMAKDPRAYLEGRAVGCVATGAGWQGCNSALHALRSIVHALRGWPSPLGIALNTREPAFDSDGECLVPELSMQMKVMAQQLIEFAGRSR
jgi:FMN reductase